VVTAKVATVIAAKATTGLPALLRLPPILILLQEAAAEAAAVLPEVVAVAAVVVDVAEEVVINLTPAFNPIISYRI
jgi:hypothetical protein